MQSAPKRSNLCYNERQKKRLSAGMRISRPDSQREDKNDMFKDLTGKTCFKLGLHTHTTLSDGHLTPTEVAKAYRAAGYDAIALTDHWKYGPAQTLEGLKIFSGVEYNIDTGDSTYGGAHIVALCMDYDPCLDPAHTTIPQAIEAIHKAGGIAVLAHPAWSLCQVEDMLSYEGIDATEIYNTVSTAHESDRPYSGLLLDLLANKGRTWPLFASDDAHYYDGSDEVLAATVIHADELTEKTFKDAVLRRDLYATQCRVQYAPRKNDNGPEVHLWRDGDTVRILCSPAVKISLLSNLVWSQNRITRGENLTEAAYRLHEKDKYIRAEVTDAEGRMAFSSYIVL